MLNKTQFIRAWAEQSGSSHEDWSLDSALATILGAQIYIGGLHGALAELATTTEVVLNIADQFLSHWYRSRSSARNRDA